ncbi:MAG: FAD:protein FMN transferase, partial [Oscillospiraceae bacterium]|nr:FAD:protein FMN transferase [Oscillospiraceae bacterium]
KHFSEDIKQFVLVHRVFNKQIIAVIHIVPVHIQAVGTRPDGNPWRVAIQDPDSQQEATLGVVEVSDQAVITSGGYQRYFEADGETYWHIMDPDTAAPARSGLTSVTVIGADGTVCDALSTALFVMGPEEAAAFWRAHPELGVELILVLEDGTVQITQGLEETFTLSQDRTMEVIAP